jgi:hypothetical protein
MEVFIVHKTNGDFISSRQALRRKRLSERLRRRRFTVGRAFMAAEALLREPTTVYSRRAAADMYATTPKYLNAALLILKVGDPRLETYAHCFSLPQAAKEARRRLALMQTPYGIPAHLTAAFASGSTSVHN